MQSTLKKVSTRSREFYEKFASCIMAWEGFECTSSVRLIVGSTNPREATAGTLREISLLESEKQCARIRRRRSRSF